MRLSMICEALEQIAPGKLAEEYDNTGLLLGNPTAKIESIAIALEATEQTVQAAIEKGADLLVVHHPFLFKPIKKIDLSTPSGQIISKAIGSSLAIWVAHTNFDAVKDGMNDALAALLDLKNLSLIEPAAHERQYKIVTFVPEKQLEQVAGALFKAGAGIIGGYRGCSFRTNGTGTFIPQPGTAPHIGTIGKLSKELETRLEVIVPTKNLNSAIEKMIAAHPYEEVAYDVYPLKGKESANGHGRIGTPPKPVSLQTFSKHVKAALKLKTLRRIGNPKTKIERVAVCSGSGAFMIPSIRPAQGTCLVTGDIKYHDARLAEELGLCVIDAGHFGTEIIFIRTMKKLLQRQNSLKNKVKLISIPNEKDPFVTV